MAIEKVHQIVTVPEREIGEIRQFLAHENAARADNIRRYQAIAQASSQRAAYLERVAQIVPDVDRDRILADARAARVEAENYSLISDLEQQALTFYQLQEKRLDALPVGRLFEKGER